MTNFDVMPTLLRLSRTDFEDQQLDAVDLVPLLDGTTRSLDLEAFAGFPHVRMLRSSSHKLLAFRDGKRELYDLSEDPGELRNLAQSRTDERETSISHIQAGLERRLAHLKARLQVPVDEDPLVTQTDPETKRQLLALGYVD